MLTLPVPASQLLSSAPEPAAARSCWPPHELSVSAEARAMPASVVMRFMVFPNPVGASTAVGGWCGYGFTGVPAVSVVDTSAGREVDFLRRTRCRSTAAASRTKPATMEVGTR